MIQLLSRLEVADNTGAKKVRMIRRIGQNKKTASIGDIIVCHVKECTTDSAVKKGTVVRALVVRTKTAVRRRDGSYLRFDENAVVGSSFKVTCLSSTAALAFLAHDIIDGLAANTGGINLK